MTGPPSEDQIHSSQRVHFPCDLKKRVNAKLGGNQECTNSHKLGGMEFHVGSGLYRVSGMSSMSSEKHPAWQVL